MKGRVRGDDYLLVARHPHIIDEVIILFIVSVGMTKAIGTCPLNMNETDVVRGESREKE